MTKHLKLIFSVIYEQATRNTDLSENVNASIERVIITTLNSNDVKGDLNTVLKDFNSEFIVFKKDFSEASEPIWELNIETEILYQSEDLITIAISTYEFKGGAHGNDKIKLVNLNVKTGQSLNHNEIIEDLSSFKTIAQKYFVKSLEIKKNNLKMEDFFFDKPFELPENIGFSEDGLV